MPKLERREQLHMFNEYLFVRVDDQIGYERISRIRTHKHLAQETHIHHGRSPEGRWVVSDAGRIKIEPGTTTLPADPFDTVEVELPKLPEGKKLTQFQLDTHLFEQRKKTGQLLADFLQHDVEVIYKHIGNNSLERVRLHPSRV